MRIRWTERSSSQLVQITEYIAEERPQAAERMLHRLREAVQKVGEAPFVGRMVPELQVPSIREKIVGPYRVIYLVLDESVVVLSIYHSRRQLPETVEGLARR